MHVTIDRTLCQGNGYCVRVAPEVFEMGDDGKAHVLIDQPVEGLQAAAEEAELVCPARAIRL